MYTKLQRTEELETFYDLCACYGHWTAKHIGEISRYFPDSRATMDVLLDWSNEFNAKNDGREWDGEYMEEIDAFFDTKLAEIGHSVTLYCNIMPK